MIGTRPELIKLSDAIHHLRGDQSVDVVAIFTGQHTELLDSVAEVLGIVPEHRISPLPAGRSLTDLLANVIRELGSLFTRISPCGVLLQGDTVSALAGALVAEMMQIPLLHLEAGVRSLARNDPFPEETIRRIISPIAEHHLCFSAATRQNLLREGVDPTTVTLVPHPLVDRVRNMVTCDPRTAGTILVTLHRRERRSERLAAIKEIAYRVRKQTDVDFEFVWHPALDAEEYSLRADLAESGIRVMAPMDPDAFLLALANARIVVTDSAGVSEEAQLLGKPLVNFRLSAESRIDELPNAPTLVTESALDASDFIVSHARRTDNLSPPPTEATPTVRAGANIARAIHRVLMQFEDVEGQVP